MPATIHGPYTLGAKSTWYYWFYADNSWRNYQSEMDNPKMLYILPRPQSSSPEWGVLPVHTRVVLEQSQSNPKTYRYSYRILVENPTDVTVGFYIAAGGATERL